MNSWTARVPWRVTVVFVLGVLLVHWSVTHTHSMTTVAHHHSVEAAGEVDHHRAHDHGPAAPSTAVVLAATNYCLPHSPDEPFGGGVACDSHAGLAGMVERDADDPATPVAGFLLVLMALTGVVPLPVWVSRPVWRWPRRHLRGRARLMLLQVCRT